MSYKINPAEFSSMLAIPSSVVEKHLKLSGAIQLKVLLLAMHSISSGIDPEKISKELSISVPDVTDALNYWAETGVIINDEQKPAPEALQKTNPEKLPAKRIIRAEVIKPTREEVIKRGNESKEIAFMLREAQMKFGRTLRQSETSTLVWLHDDEGMDISVILMLLSFAVAEGKPTIGYIEKTAVSWINSGVETIADAENVINKYHLQKSAWRTVENAMGIDRRQPSAKETELAYTWVCDYEFGADILKLAYDICVDSTAKLSFRYIKKILDSWHKSNVKSVEDVEKLKAKEQDEKKNGKKSKIAKYDIDLYNEALNELPE